MQNGSFSLTKSFLFFLFFFYFFQSVRLSVSFLFPYLLPAYASFCSVGFFFFFFSSHWGGQPFNSCITWLSCITVCIKYFYEGEASKLSRLVCDWWYWENWKKCLYRYWLSLAVVDFDTVCIYIHKRAALESAGADFD